MLIGRDEDNSSSYIFLFIRIIFDYANKYQADATLEVCPADIPEETASRMMELTVKAFRALKLNVYSRADFSSG